MSDIKRERRAGGTMVATLGGLGARSARQTTFVENTGNCSFAIFHITLKSGEAPAFGGLYEVYLLRDINGRRDDNAGLVDAPIVIENATYLGSIFTTPTPDKTFYGVFDTGRFLLTRHFGIAILNKTSQALSLVNTDHSIVYDFYVDTI